MSVVERVEAVESLDRETTPNVYLFPGQIFTSAEPALVSTVIGSCVAVCLWDDELSIGGMNHFLLPSNPLRNAADARYGNTAMARLLENMVGRGASLRRLVAKIVGGACVLDSFAARRHSIGEQNVTVAREFLQRLDITITGDQTGGRHGRKLLFHTGNGSAYVKEI